MKISCPYCKKTLEVGDEYAGMNAQCPLCRKQFVIPQKGIPVINVSVNFKNETSNCASFSTNDQKYQPEQKQKLLTWFSVKGRATRREYWIKTGIFLLIQIIIIKFIKSVPGGDLTHPIAGCISVLFLPIVIDLILTHVRRFHDQNLSSLSYIFIWILYAIFMKLPYLGGFVLIVLFIMLGFPKGTFGPNRYGSDPRGIKHIINNF
jgi:uncharacterized membrane protein YhaH (DUF805 family)